MTTAPESLKGSLTPKWEAVMLRNAERHERDIDARVRALHNAHTEVQACMFELFEECFRTAQMYLCNYASATDHNGNAHEMATVNDELSKHLRECYKKMCGASYTPSICRGRNEQ